jgi:hypothetical protein
MCRRWPRACSKDRFVGMTAAADCPCAWAKALRPAQRSAPSRQAAEVNGRHSLCDCLQLLRRVKMLQTVHLQCIGGVRLGLEKHALWKWGWQPRPVSRHMDSSTNTTGVVNGRTSNTTMNHTSRDNCSPRYGMHATLVQCMDAGNRTANACLLRNAPAQSAAGAPGCPGRPAHRPGARRARAWRRRQHMAPAAPPPVAPAQLGTWAAAAAAEVDMACNHVAAAAARPRGTTHSRKGPRRRTVGSCRAHAEASAERSATGQAPQAPCRTLLPAWWLAP